MNRSEILDKAKEIVTKDRQATHGNAEDNFELIRKLWSAYLGIELSREDVAIMQILLKVARAKSNPKHEDNWIDICGYSSCGGEIATKKVPATEVEFIGDNPVTLCRNDEIKPGGSTDE